MLPGIFHDAAVNVTFGRNGTECSVNLLFKSYETADSKVFEPSSKQPVQRYFPTRSDTYLLTIKIMRTGRPNSVGKGWAVQG